MFFHESVSTILQLVVVLNLPFKVHGHFQNVFREDFGNLRTFKYITRIKVQEAKFFGEYTL